MKKQNPLPETSTQVSCPNCGTKLTINISTSQPINPSTSQPPTLPSRATDRIEALRSAGIDVSSFFAMTGSNGGEYVATQREGKLTIISDDDPIYQVILQQGTVPNGKLFRRWVMAQMFHMLAAEKEGRYFHSITQQIHQRGYNYQWEQVENEINAQMHMMKNGDAENYTDRNRWFNQETVVLMFEDYKYQLQQYIKKAPVHHCKGTPYKRICGNNVFLTDINKKVINPINELIKLAKEGHYMQAIRQFRRANLKNNYWTPNQSQAWIDAYKGSGAFFTMQNLIRFHGCTFLNENGTRMDKQASYAHLQLKAVEYTGEGWRLLGLLRQFIKDNHIDIAKKMKSWRKK